MADRRPLSTLTAGGFDFPPATTPSTDDVTSRLDRFRRTLERQREESMDQATLSRHERWGPPHNSRRRGRLLRPAGPHSPTYEGRSWSLEDGSDDEYERSRHMKRRRLHSYGAFGDKPYFKYGRYGQVEPGPLRLDLCSCDGGVHDEKSVIYYGPNNILKHDQSVYSSKASTCNIILQHHGETSFNLEKLIIIAPEHGFTAPVKKGSVCVGMSLDDLYAVQADLLLYDMEDSSVDTEDDMIGNDEDLNLLGLGNHSRHSVATSDMVEARYAPQSPRLPLQIPEPLPPANTTSRRDGMVWSGDTTWPVLEPRLPPRRLPLNRSVHSSENVEATLASGVKVVIAHDEDIDWPEEPTSATVLADRQRREQRARDDDPGTEDDDERSRAWDPRYRTNFNRLRRGTRPRIRPTRSLGTSPPEEQKPPSRDVHQVRFKMKEGRNKVAIKFEPPVAGTYLLLQLQTPKLGLNIDIQTVIACGYAGPRFLPAIQRR